MRCAGNGLVVVTFNTHPIITVRMLSMVENDIRPVSALEGDSSGRFRNLGLLAGTVIRNTTLSEQSDDEDDHGKKSYSQQESLHKILLLFNLGVVPSLLKNNSTVRLERKGIALQPR